MVITKSRYRPGSNREMSVDVFVGAVFFLTALCTTGCRVIIVPPVMMLTDVRVSPAIAAAETGGTFSFTAEVDGMTDQSVTWTIIEAAEVSAGTSINAYGVLTVAPDETLSGLTVRATSGMDTTISGVAVVTVTIVPTVTGITVDPPEIDLSQGGTETFTAVVSGYHEPDQSVTWSIDEADDADEFTTIDESGYLSISLTETLLSITVRATSVADPTISETVVVTITPP